jgi:hypothetical protein
MGILEYLLKGLGKEARQELAKDAAKAAVKNVGDAVYEKADGIRQDFEHAAAERREQKERERAVVEKREQAVKAGRAIEDELAALKAKVERDD